MENILSLLEIVVPILTCILLGVLARKKEIITVEQNRGVQQFVLKFCIPPVLFNSCLEAKIGAESLTTMVMLLPVLLLSSLWAFRARKKNFPYHNFPMLFAAHETGMIGLPLCIILFGTAEAYRMGILDMTQGLISIPVMVILASDTGKGASIATIIKKVLLSPMLIMSLLGFALGLSGAMAKLDAVGVGGIIRESTGFLAQPVSAAMLFSIGYNFSLSSENRKEVLKIAGIGFVFSVAACLIMQGVLFLIPGVDALTRWVVLLYCSLPASFLAPSLSRNEKESVVSSGVCSLLTVVTLISFCVIAAFS
jgi:predicted permease